jgi:hypothetical protein
MQISCDRHFPSLQLVLRRLIDHFLLTVHSGHTLLLSVCVCVCMHACMYVCMYVCMHVGNGQKGVESDAAASFWKSSYNHNLNC